MRSMISSMTGTGKSSSQSGKDLDFDDEAKALFERLNLDPNSKSSGQWNPVDPIFRHPKGRGTIYVGNQTAAENYIFLKNLGITRVVNCTNGVSKIPDFHKDKLGYYTFMISHWQSHTNATNESVLEFANPMFMFIDEAISRGESVLVSVEQMATHFMPRFPPIRPISSPHPILHPHPILTLTPPSLLLLILLAHPSSSPHHQVHCLAGAHRAGTTGCACLMHFAGMDVPTAISTAKKCRPIIDPIGQLPDFLHRLKKATDALEKGKEGSK